jgi:hypothetical protein
MSHVLSTLSENSSKLVLRHWKDLVKSSKNPKFEKNRFDIDEEILFWILKF